MKFKIKLATEFGWSEKRSHEICTVERRSLDASEESLGLCLAEAQSILREIQRALLQDQIEEVGEIVRVCRFRGTYLPVHDRRRRRIETLFGRVILEAPQVRICMSGLPGYADSRLCSEAECSDTKQEVGTCDDDSYTVQREPVSPLFKYIRTPTRYSLAHRDTR